MLLETTLRILIIVDYDRIPTEESISALRTTERIERNLHQAIRNTTDKYGSILSVHIKTEKPVQQIG